MSETLRTVLVFVGAVNVILVAVLGCRPFLEWLADEDAAEFWATPKPSSNVVEFQRRHSLSAAALGKARRIS